MTGCMFRYAAGRRTSLEPRACCVCGTAHSTQHTAHSAAEGWQHVPAAGPCAPACPLADTPGGFGPATAASADPAVRARAARASACCCTATCAAWQKFPGLGQKGNVHSMPATAALKACCPQGKEQGGGSTTRQAVLHAGCCTLHRGCLYDPLSRNPPLPPKRYVSTPFHSLTAPAAR